MLPLTIIVFIFSSCTNAISSYDYYDPLCVTYHRQSSLNGKYVHWFYSSSIPGDIYYCSSCGSDGIYIYPVEVQYGSDSSEVYHWVFGDTLYSTIVYSICKEYTYSGLRSLMWRYLTDDCDNEWESWSGSDWVYDYIDVDACTDTTTPSPTDTTKKYYPTYTTKKQYPTYSTDSRTNVSSDSNTGTIIGIVVAVIIVLIVVGIVVWLIKRKPTKAKPVNVAPTHDEQIQMMPSEQKPAPPYIQQVKQVPMVAAPPYIQQVKQVPIVATPHTEQIQMIRSEYKPAPQYQQQVKQVPVVAAPTVQKPPPSTAYKYQTVSTGIPPPAYAPQTEGDVADFDENSEIKQWFNSAVNLPEDRDRYFNMFIENGFDSLDIIKQMKGNDLVEMGITKLGHKRLILIAISKL